MCFLWHLLWLDLVQLVPSLPLFTSFSDTNPWKQLQLQPANSFLWQVFVELALAEEKSAYKQADQYRWRWFALFDFLDNCFHLFSPLFVIRKRKKKRSKNFFPLLIYLQNESSLGQDIMNSCHDSAFSYWVIQAYGSA